MIYRKAGSISVAISVLSLGGHEYLSNGRSRGFNENLSLAIEPGHTFEGFGQEERKRVLSAAFEHGINFFDVTQDSEKEALGRNLKEIRPPYEIYVQTRPEGMVYRYDEFNKKMAQYELLKAEVQRGLKLLQRDHLDFLNIAFMQSALDHDSEYLEKIEYNVENLKREAIYINFNFADCGGQHRVLPMAGRKGLGVISREAFMKGELFRMGDEVGLTDYDRLAQIALKWSLSHEEVTTVVVGVNSPDQLVSNLQVLNELELHDEELDIMETVKTSSIYKAYEERKTRGFFGQN
jgi:aryl-alcohol dehydrogenase-like predicted oxidoreductase